MEIVFLGTSSMVPTKERAQSSFILLYEGQGILFDAGENAQRQIKIAGIPLTKISVVLISHWHGDHVLGIPGLIQSLCSDDYREELKIFGPKGTRSRIRHLFEAFLFDKEMISIDIKDIQFREGSKRVFETKKYVIKALPLEHKINVVGYVFCEKDKRRIDTEKARRYGLKQCPLLGEIQSGKSVKVKGRTIKPDMVSYIVKGRKVAYISDTIPTKNALVLAKDADIVICESTYDSSLKEKAAEHFHMTAEDAAQIASHANAKKLVLTHFSGRYKDTALIEDEAKKIFPNTICAKDFMKIKV